LILVGVALLILLAGFEIGIRQVSPDAMQVRVCNRNGCPPVATRTITDAPTVADLYSRINGLPTVSYSAVDQCPKPKSNTVYYQFDFTRLGVLIEGAALVEKGCSVWDVVRGGIDVAHNDPDGQTQVILSEALTTIASPAPGSSVWSPVASLSSSLGRFLADHGDHVGAAIFDVTRKRFYPYNASHQFYMASSVKVPIMLTLLAHLEAARREPNDQEMSLLTTMIENSNNESAQALFDEIGGAPALDKFMRSVGIADFSADADHWGYSTISPLAMVNLLTLLHAGKILTAGDRQMAINLMENIESDQQIGVGDTTPTGATVAMKDGWVQAPDYLWAMNSSGIVTWHHETYIISVYSQENSSLELGQQLAEHVCQAAAAALFAS
jgi:hypothetical protein